MDGVGGKDWGGEGEGEGEGRGGSGAVRCGAVGRVLEWC